MNYAEQVHSATQLDFNGITGEQLRSMMRKHKVTIRELAKRMQITQKQIRNRRENGFAAEWLSSWCYQVAICGETPRLKAAFRQWYRWRHPSWTPDCVSQSA